MCRYAVCGDIYSLRYLTLAPASTPTSDIKLCCLQYTNKERSLEVGVVTGFPGASSGL